MLGKTLKTVGIVGALALFLGIFLNLQGEQMNHKTKEPAVANKTIVLAGGCFWGTEAYLKQLPGVVSTYTAYANSKVPNPSYEQVCTGDANAA